VQLVQGITYYTCSFVVYIPVHVYMSVVYMYVYHGIFECFRHSGWEKVVLTKNTEFKR